jgi:hypothetical protein
MFSSESHWTPLRDVAMRWVGAGSNIFALMVYCAVGTLALANYADRRRDEQEQSAKR